MSSQTKSQRQEKIDFLKSHFPQIKTMDFVMDKKNFHAAKMALVNAGFYKSTKPQYSTTVNDSSILNLIWDAQEKKRYKHQATKHNRGRRA